MADLEKQYRELYWLINECQIIGESATSSDLYKQAVKKQARIIAKLGYTPAA